MILIDKDGPYIEKDPGEVWDASMDWTAWLAEEIETTITTSTWTVPDGLTKLAESEGAGITAVMLSGGTLGATYRIENAITAGAKTGVRGLRVKIRDR